MHDGHLSTIASLSAAPAETHLGRAYSVAEYFMNRHRPSGGRISGQMLRMRHYDGYGGSLCHLVVSK